MTDYSVAQGAYQSWVSAKNIARKRARDEFRDRIEARISELTSFDRELLVDEVRGLYASGVDSAEIQLEVFGGAPLLWPEIRDAAEIPLKKRGRVAGEVVHGKPGTYNRGCRCEECRAATREYQRERARLMKGLE